MKLLNFFLLTVGFIILTSSTCYQADPFPSLLGKPAFVNVALAAKKEYDGYIESAHLAWIPPVTDSISVSYYTLTRKFPGDTIFDIFPLSQYIPADTLNFYDPLNPAVFPSGNLGLEIKSLYYKIYAIDSLGRQSEMSDPCTLSITLQPVNVVPDQDYCLKWESHINSSVSSYAQIWNDDSGISWISDKALEYSTGNDPAEFYSCPPDSLMPLVSGKWYYSLYVTVSETYSIKIGYFNVP